MRAFFRKLLDRGGHKFRVECLLQTIMNFCPFVCNPYVLQKHLEFKGNMPQSEGDAKK